MTNGIIGKKIGMISLFTLEGNQIPVSVVEAGPCYVTQVKKDSTDGYNSVQLGFGKKKKKLINKPISGHLAKSIENKDIAPFSILKEFRVNNPDDFEPGQKISLSNVFKIGEKINVSGTIKGRGFSGVVKRHGFHGGKKTHGSMSHRIPGSIGCSATPGRVLKGKKLPGQYGNTRQTVKNLEVIDIRESDNVILLKGSVPGCKSGILELKKIKQ